MSDILSSEEKKSLPSSIFGLPERREYPMPDAAHVRILGYFDLPE